MPSLIGSANSNLRVLDSHIFWSADHKITGQFVNCSDLAGSGAKERHGTGSLNNDAFEQLRHRQRFFAQTYRNAKLA